jgi:hypothetical protein
VAVFLFGVVVIAYSDKSGFQKMNHGCQDLLPWQTAERHVLANLLPNRRESVGKVDDMLVFCAFTNFAETRMVAVLLSTLGISAGRLNGRPRMGRSIHRSMREERRGP